MIKKSGKTSPEVEASKEIDPVQARDRFKRVTPKTKPVGKPPKLLQSLLARK